VEDTDSETLTDRRKSALGLTAISILTQNMGAKRKAPASKAAAAKAPKTTAAKADAEPPAAPLEPPPTGMQMLSILQELKADMSTFGKRLNTTEMGVTKLGDRVERIERTGQGPVNPYAATVPGPTGTLRVTGLPPIVRIADLHAPELLRIAELLSPDDEYAFALTCRKLNEAAKAAQERKEGAAKERKTSLSSLFSSPQRLQWGVSLGAPLSVKLTVMAAEKGSVKMLSFLQDRRCAFSSSTAAAAAEHGHLVALEWLHSVGCPMDKRVHVYAEKNAHAAVVAWAKEKELPTK
jgi:hypothetical protein